MCLKVYPVNCIIIMLYNKNDLSVLEMKGAPSTQISSARRMYFGHVHTFFSLLSLLYKLIPNLYTPIVSEFTYFSYNVLVLLEDQGLPEEVFMNKKKKKKKKIEGCTGRDTVLKPLHLNAAYNISLISNTAYSLKDPVGLY